MKNILLLSTVLVCACAFPNYEKRIDNSYPPDYKNVEILLLESAVNQDGGYSFSFENDDGSKVSQEGQQKMIDDEQAVERIRGSYSYNDVNGQPVSLTYTADENGFRPVGAHLPTPPPIPVEILRSLKYLATAKPFVDEQLYDYKPKKKVFRGRQYKTGNVVQRSRNHLRLNSFPEPLADETPSEVLLKSVEDNPDTSVDNTSDTVPEMSSENPSETSPESVQTSSSGGKKPTAESVISIVNEAKKKINDAAKETIQKASQINKSSKETSDASIAAIRGEVQKLNDNVKSQVNKINEKISGSKTKTEEQVSGSAKQSRDVIEEYTGIVSDIVSSADQVLVDVAPTEGIGSDIVSAAEAADQVLVDIAPTEGIASDIVSAADQVLADVTAAEGIASDIVSAADEVLADIATTEGIASDIVSAADEVLADIAATEETQ